MHIRIIARGFQKYRDWANIFAKGPIVLTKICKRYANDIINRIADQKTPKHYAFQIRHGQHKQRPHKYQRARKNYIPDKSKSFARSLRQFVRQQIQDHCRPTSIAAPSSAKQQRSEYFCHRIVDGSRFKYAKKQIIPKSLNLHILIA